MTSEVEPAADELELIEFGDMVAAAVTEFLADLKATADQASTGEAISLLLLQTAHISFVGAQLGAHVDVVPLEQFQPDVGPDAEVDDTRLKLAEVLGEADAYSFVFDPYQPEVVESRLSDDLMTIAADLDNGLRHYAAGNHAEALWWWQFSYVNNWGNLAGAALNALLSVVTHDRLDNAVPDEGVVALEELL